MILPVMPLVILLISIVHSLSKNQPKNLTLPDASGKSNSSSTVYEFGLVGNTAVTSVFSLTIYLLGKLLKATILVPLAH